MALEAAQAGIWTALPGIIQSFDPAAQTCVVQPAIKGRVRGKDGATQTINMPLLLDCPVAWQGGGGCTLTFPIKHGDECLVVFASRCIDAWWQSGGVQEQAEYRMHNLSDGFVLPGVRSQPRRFNVSTSAAQLRTDDGAAFVEVFPETKFIRAQTTSDIEAVAGGSISLTAAVQINISAPDIFINGSVHQAGGPTDIVGPVDVTNDVTAGGVSLMQHTHNGVEPGGGNTGQPNQ